MRTITTIRMMFSVLMGITSGTNSTWRYKGVSQAELIDSFADGWEVERIDDAYIEVRPDWEIQRPHAWLARIVRTASPKGA